jgi:hypothetical protein
MSALLQALVVLLALAQGYAARLTAPTHDTLRVEYPIGHYPEVCFVFQELDADKNPTDYAPRKCELMGDADSGHAETDWSMVGYYFDQTTGNLTAPPVKTYDVYALIYQQNDQGEWAGEFDSNPLRIEH